MLSVLFVEFAHTHTFMMHTSGSTPPRDEGCAALVLPLNPLCVTVMSVLLFIFFSLFYGFSRFWSFRLFRASQLAPLFFSVPPPPSPEGDSNLQHVLHHSGVVSAQNWLTGEPPVWRRRQSVGKGT